MPDRLDRTAPPDAADESDGTSSDARRVRVIFSYAHDEERYGRTHKDDVLALAKFLEDRHFEVHLDRFNKHRINWPQWFSDNVKSADFVLAIASEGYRAAAEGELPPDKNRGVKHELRLLRELHNSNYEEWLSKIIPVVMPTGNPSDIPTFLEPTNATYYVVNSVDAEGTKKLLEALTTRPNDPRPQRIPRLATRGDPPLNGHAVSTDIKEHYSDKPLSSEPPHESSPRPARRLRIRTWGQRVKRLSRTSKIVLAFASLSVLLIPAALVAPGLISSAPSSEDPLILNYSWPAMSGCDSRTAVAMPKGGPAASQLRFHVGEDARTTAIKAGATSWHIGHLGASLRTPNAEKIYIDHIQLEILRRVPNPELDWILQPHGGCGPVAAVQYTLSLDCPNLTGVVENPDGNPPDDLCTGEWNPQSLTASAHEPLHIGIDVHSCSPTYYEWMLRIVYFDESGVKHDRTIGSRKDPLRSVGATPAAPIYTVSPGEQNTEKIVRNTGQFSPTACDSR